MARCRGEGFMAGSKAKTVQLADFKCSVCPLDVQIEKPLPKYSVCVWPGQGQQPMGDRSQFCGLGFIPARVPANRKAEGLPQRHALKSEGTESGSIVSPYYPSLGVSNVPRH